MKKRFAVIIGAMKSGTTSLFRHLGAHPQVLPCRVKEPRFFTDEQKWALGLDWYRSLWDFREPDERIALEASTDYAKQPRVPCPASRIAQTPAGFRFVYILRDPLARIESHHTHAVAEGWSDAEPSHDTLRHYVDLSRYAMQLQGFRDHFPREDFLLLHYEELASDPLGLLRHVCSFLEIDPYFPFPELDAVHNASEGKPIRAGRSRLWRLPGLSWLARRRGPRVERKLLLTPEQRAFVLGELREDVERLEREWDFDVSRWQLG